MRNVRIVFALVVLLCVAGCTLNQQFVAAVDESWSVIGPRYEAYVQADPALDEESKATRLRTATMLTEVIYEAKQP